MKKFTLKVCSFILEGTLLLTFSAMMAISFIAILAGDGDKGLLDLL